MSNNKVEATFYDPQPEKRKWYKDAFVFSTALTFMLAGLVCALFGGIYYVMWVASNPWGLILVPLVGIIFYLIYRKG